MKGREFQICAAKMQKARPPCHFCVVVFKVGMRKVLSFEEQCRRGSASDDLIAETSYFVLNSVLWGASAVA